MQLSKIIAGFEILSIKANEYQIQLEKGWAEQRERKRISDEIEQRKKKELSDFKELLKDAERWNKIKLLRSYINEIESQSLENNTVSDDLKKWIDWARNKLAWYDPHSKIEDELLKDIDKETLTYEKRYGYY